MRTSPLLAAMVHGGCGRSPFRTHSLGRVRRGKGLEAWPGLYNDYCLLTRAVGLHSWVVCNWNSDQRNLMWCSSSTKQVIRQPEKSTTLLHVGRVNVVAALRSAAKELLAVVAWGSWAGAVGAPCRPTTSCSPVCLTVAAGSCWKPSSACFPAWGYRTTLMMEVRSPLRPHRVPRMGLPGRRLAPPST